MSREAFDVMSLGVRAAANHSRYFRLGVADMEPPQYAGKAETTCATMALDVFGASMREMVDPKEFARFTVGWCLAARACDEVVDDIVPYTDEPITVDKLTRTPVLHPLAGSNGRYVTGEEGAKIALDSTARMIPGTDRLAKQRQEVVEASLDRYIRAVADTANNPAYHQGDILPFPIAMQSRRDVTVRLGETGAAAIGALLGRFDYEKDMELFGQMSLAMQFGDDFLDCRKDWEEHSARKAQASRPVRPQENLFNATVQADELEAITFEEALSDKTRRSIVLAQELAPQSVEAFYARFEEELDRLPEHNYREKARGIIAFTFYNVLTRAPEFGRFRQWAKY